MSLAGAYILLRLCLNLPPVEKTVSLREATGPLRTNLSPALGIALTIPLGFLCYQIYHALYTPLRFGGFVSGDRGAELMQHLTADQQRQVRSAMATTIDRYQGDTHAALKEELPSEWTTALNRTLSALPTRRNTKLFFKWFNWLELDLPAGGVTSQTRRTVRNAYRARWWSNYYVSSVLLDICAIAPDAAEIKVQWVQVSDIYHGLGAARTALATGAAVGMLADACQIAFDRTGQDAGDLALTASFALVLAAVVLASIKGLNRARLLAYRSSTLRLGHGLRATFTAHPELLSRLNGILQSAAPPP